MILSKPALHDMVADAYNPRYRYHVFHMDMKSSLCALIKLGVQQHHIFASVSVNVLHCLAQSCPFDLHSNQMVGLWRLSLKRKVQIKHLVVLKNQRQT